MTNVIAFSLPAATIGPSASPACEAAPQPAMAERLAFLNRKSLSAIHVAIDALDLALGHIRLLCETIPEDAEAEWLRGERARLSVELFAIRMTAIRLSSAHAGKDAPRAQSL